MYPPSTSSAFDEVAPGAPVRPAGHVEEHDRRRLRLAGLHQRQQLERLVERAEAAGQQHEAVRLLDELELAGEEVAEVDELRVALGEELGRRRLERQPDAHAERVVGAGALEPGLHDPGAGAGDDHPVVGGHRGREPPGLVVERVVGLGAGRPEDRDLALAAVRREHVERVAHLLERGVGDLQVAAVGAVAREADGGRDQLEDEVGVLGAGLLDERGDRGVELAVAGAVAGTVFDRRATFASVRRPWSLADDRLGELRQRHRGAGAEVGDDLGRGQRAEAAAGREVVAVGEAVQEAGRVQVAGARGVDDSRSTGSASMTCTSSRADDDRALLAAGEGRDLAVLADLLERVVEVVDLVERADLVLVREQDVDLVRRRGRGTRRGGDRRRTGRTA